MSTPNHRPTYFVSGSKYSHNSRDDEMEAPSKTIRVQVEGGYRFRKVYTPVSLPKLSTIISQLKQVKTDTISLGVVGKLAYEHDSGTYHFDAHKRLYYATIKRTASLLAYLQQVYKQSKNDHAALIAALNDLMPVVWESVDTVYLTERN